MSPRLAVVPQLEAELDDLFGRPLAEFTATRNELVRRLRKAGQDDDAERIQALHKPSVAVWLVNQLARRYPDEVDKLVRVGEQLRKTQRDAFRGGGADALREATAFERQAIRELTRRAHELLTEEGRSPSRAVVERAAALLRAAAVDSDSAPLLRAGRLVDEAEASGFAAVAEIAPPVPRRAKKPQPKGDAERRRREQRLRRLRADAERLRRHAEEASEQADLAEQAAIAARAKADEARATSERAQQKVEAEDG